MKAITIFLAGFGLIVQSAFGQMLDINSPTTDNLNCAISVVPSMDSQELTLYIFGDNGHGYVSKDKCATWQELIIDPVSKRSINQALRVSDNLMIVSGGPENDLLKYSDDKGFTFQDLSLLSGGRVNSISLMTNALVLFHQAKQLTVWDTKTNSFSVVTTHINAQCPEFYTGTSIMEKPLVISRKPSTFLGEPPYYFMRKGVGSEAFKAWGITAVIRDSITSITTTATRDLLSFRGTEVGKYVYQGAFEPGGSNSVPVKTYFPTLTKDQTIHSSFIAPITQTYWHVGGDDFGKNGFIIKASTIIKTVADFSFNYVGACAFVDEYGTRGSSDDVIIVGDKGKVFSNRLDLSLPGVPKSDYIVSDANVNAGDSVTIFISGSEVGILYKVLEVGGTTPIHTFTGDGKSWQFATWAIADKDYCIIATRSEVEVKFPDLARITVIVNIGYDVSDAKVNAQWIAVIKVSGSQKGLNYVLYSLGNQLPNSPSITGTGNPIEFSFEIHVSANVTVMVQYGSKTVALTDVSAVTINQIPVPPKSDYTVSDIQVNVGDSAIVIVSGSEIGVTYKVFEESGSTIVAVYTFTGDGKSWQFKVLALVNKNYYIIAYRDALEARFADLAVVTVKPNAVVTVDLNKLAVFPNPCYDQIVVTSAIRTNALLIDQVGRVIRELQLEQESNQFSVADLKTGIYFVKTQKHVFKILKH